MYHLYGRVYTSEFTSRAISHAVILYCIMVGLRTVLNLNSYSLIGRPPVIGFAQMIVYCDLSVVPSFSCS